MNRLIDFGAGEHWFAEASLFPGFSLARVISQEKDRYKIAAENGERFAVVSGKFRYEAADPSQYPAVGDFVMADHIDGSSGDAVIHRILPRKSVFERMAAGGEHQTQVVAANIDTVFVCMSLNNNYNLSRLERYLSVAWNSGAAPVAVLTKADLCPDLAGVTAEISAAAPGTDILATSSFDKASCDKLLSYLQPGRTVSFIGSSGVGKSTLINRLIGEERLPTSQIRKDDRGRHTTTRRELLVLPGGGIVIDTPGMRELGVEAVDLSQSFSDIDALASQCRFRDCTHTAEPGCAVLKALETGQLDARRLENYQKLKREAKYNGLSFKQIESEKLNAMFEQVGGMKKARKFIRQNDKRKGKPQ
ncbi:MAG: ribosome small subunit-dependent GTPase A [Clostridiales bacterium]|nr:ribosome small subunit-dependent GTPase A [Clostridiales bacterium]